MEHSSVESVGFSSGGQKVVGVLHLPCGDAAQKNKIVVTCHGLMSSKDSQKYLDIAHRFSAEGLAVLRFDFRGSGESEGRGDLLSNRILDLRSAIDFVVDKGYKSVACSEVVMEGRPRYS
ncbi:MAG: alpha/beta hydrolase [Promethearchaeati archaeon SRVP18_Atabeyarchaeia-1]